MEENVTCAFSSTNMEGSTIEKTEQAEELTIEVPIYTSAKTETTFQVANFSFEAEPASETLQYEKNLSVSAAHEAEQTSYSQTLIEEEPRELKVRLDKWLWAARFFKTRALARSAVDKGFVLYDGERVNPGKEIELNAMITLLRQKGAGSRSPEIEANNYLVKGLSTRRRNIDSAKALYETVENPGPESRHSYPRSHTQDKKANTNANYHHPFRSRFEKNRFEKKKAPHPNQPNTVNNYPAYPTHNNNRVPYSDEDYNY